MKKYDYFFHYLKHYAKLMLIAILLLIIDVAVTTAMPWYMSRIVDDGVLAGNLDVIYNTGFRMTAVSLIGCAVAFCSSAVMSVMAQRMSNEKRNTLTQDFCFFLFLRPDVSC